MEVNTFLAIKDRLNYNDTIDEQRKYVLLIIEILKINQEVIKEGLPALEKHIQDDKLPFLLKKGLSLVHYAMEPQMIETILLNIAIVNCMDGLTALICLDGALSIQMTRPRQLRHLKRKDSIRFLVLLVFSNFYIYMGCRKGTLSRQPHPRKDLFKSS